MAPLFWGGLVVAGLLVPLVIDFFGHPLGSRGGLGGPGPGGRVHPALRRGDDARLSRPSAGPPRTRGPERGPFLYTEAGSQPGMRTYFHVKGGRLEEVKGEVVREQPLTVYVNGERFLTLLCSPFQLDALVVGYLWMEKVVEELAEITAPRDLRGGRARRRHARASGDAAHRAHPHLGLRGRHHVPHRPAPLPAAALLVAGHARAARGAGSRSSTARPSATRPPAASTARRWPTASGCW